MYLIQQVQTSTRVTLALLDMSVQWDPANQYLALLARLVTSLTLGQWVTVIHVQLAPSATCPLRRPVFPVAAPPHQQQVRHYQITQISLDLSLINSVFI